MIRSGRRSLAAAGLVAVAAVLAACGSSGGSGAPATPPPGAIQIEAKEYQFTPPTILAFSGPVTFSVKNAGNEEHEFEIFQGETVVDEIEGLVPGLTKNLTVDLEPGTYTFMCKLNGHDQLGMKGTLTVQ